MTEKYYACNVGNTGLIGISHIYQEFFVACNISSLLFCDTVIAHVHLLQHYNPLLRPPPKPLSINNAYSFLFGKSFSGPFVKKHKPSRSAKINHFFPFLGTAISSGYCSNGNNNFSSAIPVYFQQVIIIYRHTETFSRQRRPPLPR